MRIWKVLLREIDPVEIKNSGIEIIVRDNKDKHLGKLLVTKSQVIWCKGKTQKENGVSLKWDDFFQLMEKSNLNR